MDPNSRIYQELRTIMVNLDNAKRTRDWEAVDRASQRVAELIVSDY